MTVADMAGQLAAGLRMALVLLAVSSLHTLAAKEQVSDDAPEMIPAALVVAERKLHARAWLMFSLAVLAFSPLHAAWLLGRPAGLLYSKVGDVFASALACGAFVQLLATRGHARGLSVERVRRGAIANIATIAGVVLAALVLHHG